MSKENNKTQLDLGQNPSVKDFKAMLSALNETALVSIADIKGDITFANEKFVEVSKYSLDELIGQNHRLLKSGDQPDEMFVNLWKTISSGKNWRGEIKNKAKDGSYYWVDTSIAPILNDKGRPERYIAVRFLITDKKEFEQENQEQEEKRREFISMISHQLRTPITSARWILQMIQETSPTEGVQDAFHKIDNLNNIIGTLLFFVENENVLGKVQGQKKEVDLTEIVSSQLSLFEAKIKTKKIIMLNKIPASIFVSADEVLLNRVVYSLIENAVIYNKDHGEIEITAEKSHEHIVLKIRDTGYGIPDKEQEKIFTKYFRATNASLGANEGSGLSLYIAHQIMQIFGGSISFRSKENEGTTFHLQFSL